MFFFNYLSLSGAEDLVDKQITALEKLMDNLRESPLEDGDEFKKLVYGFKIRSVKGLLEWLDQKARTFARKKDHN